MENILSRRDSDSLIQSMSKAVEISLDNLFLLAEKQNDFYFLQRTIDKYNYIIEKRSSSIQGLKKMMEDLREEEELREDEEWLAENLEAIKKEPTISHEELMKSIFDNKIKVVREKLGISQSELARRLKKKPSEISRWESKAVTPTMKNYTLISEALGCDLLDLI